MSAIQPRESHGNAVPDPFPPLIRLAFENKFTETGAAREGVVVSEVR